MEESTPIFDALWEKYNSTPIFDQVVREHEQKKYQKLVKPYAYPLNDKRVFTPEELEEMLLRNEILSAEEIKALFRIPPTDADYATLNKEKELMTKNWQELVNDFRKAMDLPVSDTPRTLSTEEQDLHIQMIRDEFEKEFVPAFRDGDLIEMYDAGIDVIVYVIGALSNAGLEIDPGFREIMRSNMSKMDPETGKAIKAGPNDPSGEPEGKVLKGPNYKAPNLAPIINEQFRFGAESTTVYDLKRVPLRFGIGGPKIGEGSLYMDHNGELMFEGVVEDVADLPMLTGISFYSEAFPGEDRRKDISIEEMPFEAYVSEYVLPEGVVEVDSDEYRESMEEKEPEPTTSFNDTVLTKETVSKIKGRVYPPGMSPE